MPVLRWDDVPLLLALLRHRNLAGAGRSLGLDASTASRRLAALEKTTGARLFDRTRQGLVPTAAAEEMRGPAEEMERAALKLQSAAQTFEAEIEGVVRIAVIPGVADGHLAPRLPELLARHPRLRIELDVRSQVSDLTRREADIAIRSIRPRSGELVMTRLTTARWLAMTSTDHARELGVLGDWDAARWITWDDDLAHIPVARWVADHTSRPPVLRTSSIGSQIAAARSGLGVVLLDEFTPRAAPGLSPVRYAAALERDAAGWPVDDLWLVGHAALRDTPRVAAVWDFLVEMIDAATKPASKRKPTTRRLKGRGAG
jgi:DNA-binding transcriptional LysR family regulator